MKTRRKRQQDRKKSRAWLEIGLRRLMETRAIAADRVNKLDAKIKRREAEILELNG